MKIQHIIFTGVLLLASVLSAQPQPLYKIDLVVFTHVSANALLSEEWPSHPLLPDMRRVYDLQAAPIIAAGSSAPLLRQPYQIFPSAAMQTILSKLNNNKNYQVVLSTAWLTPGVKIRRARRIHIYGGQAYDASGEPMMAVSPLNQTDDNPLPNPQKPANWQVDGFVRVSKPYLFQVNADLVLTIPQAIIAKVSKKAAAKLKTNQFVLRQMYRMKLNELYYVDHPLYGMLVEITPYPKS